MLLAKPFGGGGPPWSFARVFLVFLEGVLERVFERGKIVSLEGFLSVEARARVS